jgi:glutathione S-transferase
MKIYGDLGSGNCLKAKYTADYLKHPYEWVPIDIMKGESRTPQFLAMNPQGQVPVLQLDDGRAIAQSNAIIRYLAAGSELLPQDPFLQAKVDELLFWEQYNHEPTIAVCRFHMLYLGRPKEALEPQRVERGNAALDLMQKLLSGRSYFVGDNLTIADISLVAYTRLANEGGFDLASRPAVRGWIARVEKALGIPAATPATVG